MAMAGLVVRAAVASAAHVGRINGYWGSGVLRVSGRVRVCCKTADRYSRPLLAGAAAAGFLCVSLAFQFLALARLVPAARPAAESVAWLDLDQPDIGGDQFVSHSRNSQSLDLEYHLRCIVCTAMRRFMGMA